MSVWACDLMFSAQNTKNVSKSSRFPCKKRNFRLRVVVAFVIGFRFVTSAMFSSNLCATVDLGQNPIANLRVFRHIQFTTNPGETIIGVSNTLHCSRHFVSTHSYYYLY